MRLPLVNTFVTPYEVLNTRTLNQDKINTSLESAIYMANVGVDNALENFIDSFLDIDMNYKIWGQKMPYVTPKDLFTFQQQYPSYSINKVDFEINKIGFTLSDGQYLFHGGLWNEERGDEFITNKPFSTSFCSQVAFRNAEWNGKAYDANQIDLLVLRVVNPQTNVFAFKRKGTKMGNEKEVLFSSGARLKLRNRIFIKNTKAYKGFPTKEKMVPIYVLEVDIS